MLFSDIIGQEEIRKKLIASTQAGRVSHAQLFLGKNGTGTLPLALAYVQYVNCENPRESDSCGTCRSCRQTMAVEHPDLHFSYPVITKKPGQKPVALDYIQEWRAALKENPYLSYADWMTAIDAENKQGNITAEECRDIIKKLSLKPLYDGYKILLMWMPEMLGKEGNILLKILEEPPANTLFILVAEDEKQLLPTIISRTQMLRVPAIASRMLQDALVERNQVDVEKASQIAHLAEGNYNDALKLINEVENDFTQAFIDWMRACFRPDMPVVLKWVDTMAGTGRESQKNFLLYSLRMIRESMLAGTRVPVLNHLSQSEYEFVQKFSAMIGEANAAELSAALSTAHYHIERNANPKILFFNLSLLINELLQRQKALA
jgi:DNA polymerase III subunit delta'